MKDSVRLGALYAAAQQSFRPLSALIELTHRCHLACVHCYLDDNHQWHDKAHELTTDEVTSIISQLHDAGCMFLTLTGGEIFLRRDALTIASHARGLGMAVTLFTTGTLLDEVKADAIAALHVRGVEFSLYSADPAVHDHITRSPGSHGKTMHALELLRARKVSVTIKCPLMRSNFDSYAGLRALADQLGISLLVDATVSPMNDGDMRPASERLSTDQMVEFFARPELQPWSRVHRRLPLADESICAIGKRSCVIGPFGDVRTCLGYNKPIGNLREHSFAEIWRDEGLLYKLRRIRAADVNVCSSCEKISYCNRCAGMAALEDGSFDGPSSWSCHIAAAKEKAAGLPVTLSAAERLGLVKVVEERARYSLKVLHD